MNSVVRKFGLLARLSAHFRDAELLSGSRRPQAAVWLEGRTHGRVHRRLLREPSVTGRGDTMATVSGSSSYAAAGKVLTQARVGSADVKSMVLSI